MGHDPLVLSLGRGSRPNRYFSGQSLQQRYVAQVPRLVFSLLSLLDGHHVVTLGQSTYGCRTGEFCDSASFAIAKRAYGLTVSCLLVCLCRGFSLFVTGVDLFDRQGAQQRSGLFDVSVYRYVVDSRLWFVGHGISHRFGHFFQYAQTHHPFGALLDVCVWVHRLYRAGLAANSPRRIGATSGTKHRDRRALGPQTLLLLAQHFLSQRRRRRG